VTAEQEPTPTLEAGAASRATRAKLNAAGEERPAFLLEFPEDPELEPLILAFEAGDFLKVRRDAPRLAQRTHDAAVRKAALELRSRTDPDPLLVTMLALTLALFAFLVIWVYAK
jgi:hypothetical protein